jgi:hypothetical protein
MERNYEILCLAFLSAQPVAAYSEGPSILHSMSIAHTHYPIIPSVLAVDFPLSGFWIQGLVILFYVNRSSEHEKNSGDLGKFQVTEIQFFHIS